MIAEITLLGAPEIPGSKCHKCGSALLRIPDGTYCGWCEVVSIDDVIRELGLDDTPEVRDLLDDLETEAYNLGYDEGRSECDYGDYL